MLSVIILYNRQGITQSVFDNLLRFVDINRQKRIKGFHFKRDALNCLLSDVIVRSEICKLTGLNNSSLIFGANEYGKPFLLNCPDIHYNVSHSDEFIAIALSDSQVGIDVEFIKPIRIDIAEQFFSPDEVNYIKSGIKPDDKIYRFFEIWTMKESFVKLKGMGLYLELSSFSVLENSKKGKIFYRRVYYDSNYLCHLCSKKVQIPDLKLIDMKYLLKSVEENIEKLKR